jgi:hypothetical protein
VDLDVKRESTVAGELIKFQFKNKGNKVIIKNFTEGNLYVRIQSDSKEAVRIPPLFYQVLLIGEDLTRNKTNIDTVYVTPDKTSADGVEVQLLVKEQA